MQEYLDFIGSSRLAAIGAGVGLIGTLLALWSVVRSVITLIRKTVLAARCLMRAFRLARERARNFPAQSASALRYEIHDARRMFIIESASMGVFWKRMLQGVAALLLAALGVTGCSVAWGLRDAAAYTDSADLGRVHVEDGVLVWNDGGPEPQEFLLFSGETFVAFEGEELVFPSWASPLGLVRHHRVRTAHLYGTGTLPRSPGALTRSLDLTGDSPFFEKARVKPWKSRFSIDFVRVVSPAADFTRGPLLLRVLDSGYALTPIGETRGTVSQEEN